MTLVNPVLQVVQGPANGDNEMSVLLHVLTALKKGQRDVRLPLEWIGITSKVAETFNKVAEMNERLASELERLRQSVGKEGRLSQRLQVGNISGFWRDSVESVNDLIDDLVHPATETARVIGAVAQGDLSKTTALQIDGRILQGEFLHTAKTMKGDREKCIEAGTWDYLSKPIDTEQMMTVLRAWLHR